MKTELLQLSGTEADDDLLRSAAAVIDGGGLVAFPTETVYGIACRAHCESIERLNKVKSRDASKFYTLHVSSASDISAYVPYIPPRARKLAMKALPGPITLVFQLSPKSIDILKGQINPDVFDILYNGDSIGVRCPDNPIAERLLSFTMAPVVAPSANVGGQPPAVTAKEAFDNLNGMVDMVIAPPEGTENDECTHKMSSTVVKITDENLQILRQGAVSGEDMKVMSTVNFVFVCTGNTCRSPMAEGLCRKKLSEKLNCNLDELLAKGYKISSAGVMAAEGMPPSTEAVNVCRKIGVDISAYSSSALTAEMLGESDYIFALAGGHRRNIEYINPEAGNKSLLLDASADIIDPIGGSNEVYRQCAMHIEKALENRLNEIFS
jgi:protein-tyrosine phosphatase